MSLKKIIILTVIAVFCILLFIITRNERSRVETLKETPFENQVNSTDINLNNQNNKADVTTPEKSKKEICIEDLLLIETLTNYISFRLKEVEFNYKNIPDEIEYARFIGNWNREITSTTDSFFSRLNNCINEFNIKLLMTNFRQVGIYYASENDKDINYFSLKTKKQIDIVKDTIRKLSLENNYVKSSKKNHNKYLFFDAQKFADGNITYLIGLYSNNHNDCEWEDGNISIKIFDLKNVLIKQYSKKFVKKHHLDCQQSEEYSNIYMGNALKKAHKINIEYTTCFGNEYSIENYIIDDNINSTF
jgi:hypothetical protein